MRATDQLLLLAKAYQRATGAPDTTISSRIFNDGKKLAAIKAGGDLTTGRFEEAVQAFSDRWPASAKWPKNVARPASRQDAA